LESDLHWQPDNSEIDIHKLASRLARYKLSRIIVEATGGYERKLVKQLAAKGLPVVIVQPVQVRQFAKAQGIPAKTDKIDALVLEKFGSILKPNVRPIQSHKVRYIKDLLARKRQLPEARTQELNRVQKADKSMSPSHVDSSKSWTKKSNGSILACKNLSLR